MKALPTQTVKWSGTHAERININTDAIVTQVIFYETDTGTNYQWDGGSWYRVAVNRMDLAVQVIWNPNTLDYEIATGGAEPGANVNVTNFPATQPISAVSLPLPSGAATGNKQDSGNTSLASIDSKLTNPLPVSGSVTVGGTIAVSNMIPAVETGLAKDATLTNGTQHAVIDSGTISTITNPVAVTGTFWQATQPISGAVSFTAPQHVILDSGSVTATVSGSVTANAGTNLNTSLLALESGGNLATIAGKDFATQTTLALIKAKTDNLDVALSTRLKAADTLAAVTTVGAVTAITNALPTGANVIGGVTQSGTWNITNVSGTISLPTGAATAVRQDTGNASLSSIDGKITAVNTGAVVLTTSTAEIGNVKNSGTFAVQASQSGTWNINNVSGTVSLPTGAALEAGNLATLAGKDFATQTTLATRALESGGNLATINTNTAPFLVATAGGYVRQDSTATIAKESGGNLASVAGTVKAEDSVSADGDSGLSVLAVRQDAPVTLTSVTGDYNPFTVDAQSRLWVRNDVLEKILERQNAVNAALLNEIMLLRQGFQDWSGQTDPRFDASVPIYQ